MIGGFRSIVWNIRLKGWSYVKNYAGIAAVASVGLGGVWLGIHQTRKTLNSVVAWQALDRERSGGPEYLYYNDPAHEQTLLQLFQAKGWSIWPYVGKWARRWRRAVWRRLLQVARYGDLEERTRALHHLKHLRHLKDWEVWWISQRLDGRAAMQLARMGAGPRLLGAPPLPPALRALPPRAPLAQLAQLNPNHHCLSAYLQKHNDPHQDIQQLMDSEAGSSHRSSSSDPEEELQEALGAALHHLVGRVGGASAALHFASHGGLSLVRKAAESSSRALQLTAARLLLCLSPYEELLPLMHRAGLIKCLSGWLEGKDAELVCIAGGALAGLSGGSEHYASAVQLLYPTHMTNMPPKLDVVTVHGLLGEPFVTWRQRDEEQDGKAPVFVEMDEDDDEERQYDHEYEFVLRDLPESSIRAPDDVILSHRGRIGLDRQEKKELQERTRCWPRDWLPRDCPHIRVLGVSYDTVMTEWGAGECAAEAGVGLEERARLLGAALRRAGVGQRPTLWAAHSMGGLIVKQMLVHSLQSKDQEERALAKNTWGVVFYSTPHHGTRAAQYLLWPSREVQDLREDSSVLNKLHKVWLSGGWRCVCMAEGRPTPLVPGLPRMLLVPPSSADAGVGPCYTLPLNHLDICKPATRHSFIYRQVVEMVQHAMGERCRPQGCPECAGLPVQVNPLTALYQKIFPRASAQEIPRTKQKPKAIDNKDNKEKV